MPVAFTAFAGLPDDYQRVAYVQADGKQWIDLGVKENAVYGFEIGVKKLDDGSGSGYGYLISGTKDNFTLSFHTDVNHFYAYACGAHPIADKTAFTAKAEDGFLVVAGTNGVMTVDGAMHAALNTSKPLGSGSNNIWLFNCPSDSAKRKCSGKISFAKLYDADGKVIHDYVPCYEIANPSNVGVYDTIDGAFIGNAGSGDPLIAGPDVYSPDSFRVVGNPDETGDVTPKYGKHSGYEAGESVTCTVAEKMVINAEGTMSATCVGCRLTCGDDVTETTFASDDPCSVTFTFPDCPTGAELEWVWESEYKVTAAMSDHGSVALSGEWFAHGETVTATATADEGFSFLEWSTGVPDAWSAKWKNPLTLVVTAPTALTAEFVAGSQGRLPLAYTPVAYIEATGQQWIDLGVKENAAYGFEIGVRKRDDGSGSGFGYLISGSKDNFTLSFHTDVNHYYAYACGAHPIADRTAFTATAADGFLVVAATNGVLTVDGAKHADLNTSKSLGSGSNNIWLFNCPNNNTGRLCSGKISFVKLYDMYGKLMFDGIPCLNEYGQPGFYNAVDGTFHGNIGNRAVDFETDLPATAATYTWTGEGESRNWSDAANWSRSEATAPEIPGWYSTVVIPSGSWTLNLDRPVGVKDLDLSAADVTLKLTAAESVPSLIVHGNLTFGTTSNPSRQGLWFSDVAVKVWGNLVASGSAAEIPLHFVVPKGGYPTVPFEIMGSAFADSVRGRVYVASKSPALKIKTTTSVTLVTSAKDMVVGNIALEAMPKRNPNKDSSFVWSGVRSLGAILEGCALGPIIFIQ